MKDGYESVIGLEVHVQIKTVSKLFCSCPNSFAAPPNTNICPVCCGYPGVLPVLNKKAVELLVKTALALKCEVREESIFARKQYFYPDLPKNYQISQYEKPLSENGFLNGVRIKRIHLEEDAGKLLHSVGSRTLDYSLVDLNRTGIPLMEIVSEPDIRSSDQAQEYLSSLKMILQYLEVSDCDMEKGSMRCDANISVRKKGSEILGTKVELKNMNSFRGVHDAIDYEIERQVQCLGMGERIIQETRLWDAEKTESRPMRSKEEAHDYRYFPEPDLLPLILPEDLIGKIMKTLPELPMERRERFINSYGLSAYDAGVLVSDKKLADYFENGRLSNDPNILNRPDEYKLICNWITTELLGKLNSEGIPIEKSPVPSMHMWKLVRLISTKVISGKIAKTVFEEMWNTNKDPEQIVNEKGLTQNLNESEISGWVKQAISQNPKAAEEFRSGKEKALGALVGTVMKLSKGQANPEIVNRILRQELTPP